MTSQRAAGVPVVRAAVPEDLPGLLALGAAAGTGMTNLPVDAALLERRLHASAAALDSREKRATGAPMFLVLDYGGQLAACSCVFATVGAISPFHSYRISRLSQVSASLGRSVDLEMLTLVNDLNGYAEVGGLFVSPQMRGLSIGRLTARSRYLFLAEHRNWFGPRVLAEMRGVQDGRGRSPVWEALGRRFYRMDFDEADRQCAHDARFISELGPKHPIYVDMLPLRARAALGQVHQDGRAAQALLVSEGFRYDGYVDIFDGGPTLTADIATLRALRENRVLTVTGLLESGAGEAVIVSSGRAATFRAVRTTARITGDGVLLDGATLAALAVDAGSVVRAMPA